MQQERMRLNFNVEGCDYECLISGEPVEPDYPGAILVLELEGDPIEITKTGLAAKSLIFRDKSSPVYLEASEPFTLEAVVAVRGLEGDFAETGVALASLWNAWTIYNTRQKKGLPLGRRLMMSDVTREAFLAEYERMYDEYEEEEEEPPTQADIGTTYLVSDDTIRRFCKRQHPPINWPPKR